MHRASVLLIRALLIALLTAMLAPVAGPPGAAGRDLYVLRVYFRDAAQRDDLLAALDVIEPAVHPEGYVAALGGAADLAHLRAAGYRAEIDAHLTQQVLGPWPDTFFGGYRTVDELYADMDALAAAHPDIVEVQDIGDTWCKTQGGCTFPGGLTLAGYDLRAVHVTNRAITGTKPVAFWVVAHHAREIHTPEIAMRYLDWLADNYEVDADATWMIDYHDIWVIPTANPDGHFLVEQGGNDPWWQRKNLNVVDSASWTTCGWPPTAYEQAGVDLNRNHDFHWRGPYGGWSDDPCSQTYPGLLANGPTSEPELEGYTALASSLLIDQRGPGDEDPAPITTTGIFVSIHSGTEWLLIPYDWRPDPAPNDADLQAVWDKVATWTPGWPSCHTGDCYGIVSGSAADWAYGNFGVPSTVWEIGDFMPAYSEIDSYYWPFLKPMMIYTTRIARTPYLEARGPDALNVAATPIAGGAPFTVTATINDTQNGNQAITAAELYVDTPPWAGGVPVAMAPVDGAFSTPVEAVRAVLDPATLTPGRHIIFVRGRDAGGYWGPVFATFARVPGNENYLPLVALNQHP